MAIVTILIVTKRYVTASRDTSSRPKCLLLSIEQEQRTYVSGSVLMASATKYTTTVDAQCETGSCFRLPCAYVCLLWVSV